MMSLLRKHRNWLMIVIAILALPFCLYFVKTDYRALGTDKVANIFGHDLTSVEFQRLARLRNLATELGMKSFVTAISGDGQENQNYVEFAFNLVILRHEAEHLGISPTQTEVADYIRSLHSFHGANGFDPKKYDEFTQTLLPANGFSEVQIEELATDELTLQRIKQLVANGVTISDAQTKAQFQQMYGKMFASVIKLRADEVAKDVKISDDDIKKYYEAHKAEYKTDEKRKVEFAALRLDDAQKKLTGKERIDALQKLADRAQDFTQALLEKGADFRQVAGKFQVPVDTTDEFTQRAPDAKFKGDPQLAASAFQLTKQDPTSDAVQGADGFYIMHLVSVEEARPLTLDEAKPKVVEGLKRNRTRELLSNRGAQIVREIRESLGSGANLQAALEKAKVKAEKLEPFTLAEEAEQEDAPKPDQAKNRGPEFIAVRNAVLGLQPGQVSEFFPWEDGGIIAILDKTEPPNDAEFAQKKSTLTDRTLTNMREAVFFDWLRDRQREAGLIQRAPKSS